MRYEEIKIIIKNQNKRFKNKLFIFSLLLFLSFPYADTSDTTKETDKVPRKSSKVTIAESSNIVPQPAIETLKKSLLKSTSSSSSSSVDRSLILDVKATEIRLPSPIPEDLIEEEISKQSTLSAMSDQEKKVEEKENAQEGENDRKVSEEKTLEERKEEEILKEENKCQQSRNTEGNDRDNTGQQVSETNKEIDTEKSIDDAKEQKSEVVPVQTTKLQGKSKATGRVMGGWI